MLISGARCPGSSECNLSQFCADLAERSSRVGLRPNALAFGEICPPNIHQNLYRSRSLEDPHRAQCFVNTQARRKAKQQCVCRRDTVPAAAVFPRRSRRATRFTSRLSLDYSIFSRKIHEIIVKNPLSVKSGTISQQFPLSDNLCCIA